MEEEKKVTIFVRIIRFPIVILAAAAMTLSLFYLMQSLIASSKQELDESSNINIVDFARVQQAQEIQTKKRRVDQHLNSNISRWLLMA